MNNIRNYFINIEDKFFVKEYDDSKNSIQINVPLDESFYGTDILA